MSEINSNILSKTANLAQLYLNKDEIQILEKDLSGIFKLFKTLDQPSISALEPLGHPLEEAQRLREDIPEKKDLRESIKINAPLAEDGFITVPKVIE